MANAYEILRGNLDGRRQDIRDIAALFIGRGTTVKLVAARTQDDFIDHLNNLDAIERVIQNTPYLNVGVSVGKDSNLIALKLEQETPFDPDPHESLAELEDLHGRLPTTMTIEYPNKIQYRLYEYPDQDVLRTSLATGLRIMANSVYGFVLMEPSVLNDGPVRELSHSPTIHKLPQGWIDYICSDPFAEMFDDGIEVPGGLSGAEAVTDVEPDEVILSESESELASDVAGIEEVSDVQPIINVELPTVRPEAIETKALEVSPEEYIQLEIVKMSHAGDHPGKVIEHVAAICERHSIAMPPKVQFMMIFAEAKKADRYSGAGTSNESLMRFVADVELGIVRDRHRELCCKILPTGEIVAMSTSAANKVSKYLMYRVIQLTGNVPKDIEVKNVMKIIESVGHFESDEVNMYNRVGLHEWAIYYDLGNQSAVKVTTNGWEIVDSPPIFRRYSSHKVQVTPKAGGRFERFFEFVNHEERDRLLLAVYMISSFIPNIAHPVLYVYGAHGSAKSSLAAKIKTVIDPSPLDRLVLNNKKEEIVRNLKQYYVSSYDNISHFSGETSDLFCIASTGGGMDNRKKYTDEDSHIMSFKHCVILNGIKMAIAKPDLLDRSILIQIGRFNLKRRTDEEIDALFDEALPDILGGAFDALSKAMEIYPSVELDDLPRMADFAKWGYAIAEALGGHGRAFLEAYRDNIGDQNNLIASSNTLAHAVLKLMDGKREMHITIGDAYLELKKLAKTDKADPTFPNRDNDLRGKLEELGPVLDSFGIHVEFGTVKKNYGWTVKFTNTKVAASGTSNTE